MRVSGAAQGRNVDLLDARYVHGHVADVAEHPQPAAVGGEVDVLTGIGAVELQRVFAVLALDGVAAVAGIPHERVITGAHEGKIVAASADDRVIAVSAQQHIVAIATRYRVIAGASVDVQSDHSGGQAGGGHGVVAAERIHDEPIARAFRALNRHQRRQAGHGETGAGALDLDRIVVSGAVHDQSVGLAVAGAAAGRARQVEIQTGDACARQVVDGDGVSAAQGDDIDLLETVDVHVYRTDVA